jgi:hypothetical protein
MSKKKTMERIKQIWIQLESSTTVVPGLFKVRYSETSKCDVFLGVKFPELYRILIIKTPIAIGKDFNFHYEFRGLKFEKIFDPDDSNYVLLNLILVDKQFIDIFDTLVVDVLSAVMNEVDIKVILKTYSNRLVKWQSLFERFKEDGLTPEEQRGLFGELIFLRKFLKKNSDYQSIITSWIGPEKQLRDFHFGRWSVEVKTTHCNNHQKVLISSERQLDTSNLDNLYLNHISLDVRHQSGETLNQLVDSIKELIANEFAALNLFRNKLTESGYFDHHRHVYSETGYFIRQEIFYNVTNNFPRIEERDIRSGVGDVKYSIMVSQCSDYIESEVNVLSKLRLE